MKLGAVFSTAILCGIAPFLCSLEGCTAASAPVSPVVHSTNTGSASLQPPQRMGLGGQLGVVVVAPFVTATSPIWLLTGAIEMSKYNAELERKNAVVTTPASP